MISPLQISFLIPVPAIPGRLGILFTLFLCTITIFNSVTESAPKSGGSSTAIIQWILACLFFIAMAILEYSLMLGYKKYRKYKKTDKESQMKKGKKRAQNMVWRNTKDPSKWLDKLMLIIFPLSFFLFSFIFWTSW